jgi:hypothetical protein
MHAYSYARISVAVAVLITVCVAGTLLLPQDVMAREDVKMITSSECGGGTSGGGEWRNNPQDEGELPMDGGRGRAGGGTRYSDPRSGAADVSTPEEVQAVIIRMVRFVGTTFSQLF